MSPVGNIISGATGGPAGLVIADLNNDGRDDVLVSGFTDSTVFWYVPRHICVLECLRRVRRCVGEFACPFALCRCDMTTITPTRHDISTSVASGRGLHATDVDNDGECVSPKPCAPASAPPPHHQASDLPKPCTIGCLQGTWTSCRRRSARESCTYMRILVGPCLPSLPRWLCHRGPSQIPMACTCATSTGTTCKTLLWCDALWA
jgi:hypothetical protein